MLSVLFYCKNCTGFILNILIIIFCLFAIPFSGCQSVISERYTYNDIIKESKIDGISHIILKDGSYINAENIDVFYYKKYKDTSNVLVMNVSDSIYFEVENGRQVKKEIKSIRLIPVDLVQEIYVTKKDFSPGKTIIVASAVTVGLGILTIFGIYVLFFVAGGPG